MEAKMRDLKEDEQVQAYKIWRLGYEFKNLDNELEPFLNNTTICKRKDWLKSARRALQFSTNGIAKKLKLSTQAYSKLETSEQLGSISITTLEKAADALNCELIYILRPKTMQTFSQIVWKKLLSQAANHPWVQTRPVPYKRRAIAAIARELIKDPKFRRKHGWSKRK